MRVRTQSASEVRMISEQMCVGLQNRLLIVIAFEKENLVEIQK